MSSEVKSNGQNPEPTKNPDLTSTKSSTESTPASATSAASNVTKTEPNAQSSSSATTSAASKNSANNNEASSGLNEVKSEKSENSSEVKNSEVKSESTAATQPKVERPPPRNEPIVEPKNGVAQPPTVPPASRPGRITNQLQYLRNVVIKGSESSILEAIWTKSTR